jgi:hypothetical protein
VIIMGKPPSESYGAKSARNRRNYKARKLKASYPGLVSGSDSSKSALPRPADTILDDANDIPVPGAPRALRGLKRLTSEIYNVALEIFHRGEASPRDDLPFVINIL